MTLLNDFPYTNLIEIYNFLNIDNKKKLSITLQDFSFMELLLNDIEENEIQHIISDNFTLTDVCYIGDTHRATKMIKLYASAPMKYNYMFNGDKRDNNALYYMFASNMYNILEIVIDMVDINSQHVYNDGVNESIEQYLLKQYDNPNFENWMVGYLILKMVNKPEFCDTFFMESYMAYIYDIDNFVKDIVKILISKFGSDNYEDKINYDNKTVLIECIYILNEEDVINFLEIEKDNCLPMHFDDDRMCALDYAFEKKYYALAIKLIDMYGSEYYTKSYYGRERVYELAIENGLNDCANRLLEKEGSDYLPMIKPNYVSGSDE
jgi:hypothetical protein